VKPKNDFLEQIRRSREAAKPEHKDPDHGDLEQMSADELAEARKEIEMDLIRAKSAELNERHKAQVLGTSQGGAGGYPQGKPQLFPPQKPRHWRH
jgi:hypothetical protein